MDRLFIECAAAALIFDRTVPLESQMFERALNFIGASGAHACAIKVLDPQQPAAAALPRVKVAAERGHQGAQMQRTSRGGRESADVAHAAPRLSESDSSGNGRRGRRTAARAVRGAPG